MMCQKRRRRSSASSESLSSRPPMSHHIYNTRALVLGSRTRGERDRVFALLTRDVGLVKALAQGVRRESSKLGGVLMDYAISDVSLVKGKNAWRITTATL